MTEKSIENSIKRWLKAQGWFVRKWYQGFYAGSGMPDIYALKKGRSIHLEVKRPGGRLTALQKQTIQDIQQHGGLAHVVFSLSEVKIFLDKHDLL